MLYFKRKLILCVFLFFGCVLRCVDLPYAVPDRLCFIIRRDGLIY
ncbi:hypothetical protein NEILACOT_03699 [Neisseria lactamica ATCC 23970]|uniref:Lipoprotein n=1 Tax=Neisseria lactamica ATCC 23970 TaxID=546265 RepID=D0W846_NEILA|nr:hypothetical protein NEILACOT_03699 [Neisseria lactamica ATCC 23970]